MWIERRLESLGLAAAALADLALAAPHPHPPPHSNPTPASPPQLVAMPHGNYARLVRHQITRNTASLRSVYSRSRSALGAAGGAGGGGAAPADA